MTHRGLRILAALAAAGRDQAWLRRATGLGANTIARLLHDPRQTPTPATLQAVARSTGLTAAWLAPGDARRELTLPETAEVWRCVRVLRAIARGTRVDARSLPNVQPLPARRVPPAFHLHGARHVYRALGPSLHHDGVLDGDLLYVRPTTRIRDVAGALVVARLNGLLYLKRLRVAERGTVTLSSAADGYAPIVIGADDAFTLVGEVVASVREYRG